MGFLSKIFGKNNNGEHKTGGMEDYMRRLLLKLQV